MERMLREGKKSSSHVYLESPQKNEDNPRDEQTDSDNNNNNRNMNILQHKSEEGLSAGRQDDQGEVRQPVREDSHVDIPSLQSGRCHNLQDIGGDAEFDIVSEEEEQKAIEAIEDMEGIYIYIYIYIYVYIYIYI